MIANYPRVALVFIALVLLTQKTTLFSHTHKIKTVIRFIANYSFTLYLVHYTILHFITLYWKLDPSLGALFGIIVANLIAIALAFFTEFRHRQLANWVWDKIPKLG
jgi:peptidoglycan/LPS O-acetylase OafA/YrhL